MEPRIDYWEKAPDSLKSILNLEKIVNESELEPSGYRAGIGAGKL